MTIESDFHSSNEELTRSIGEKSWSKTRSSCESEISQVAPLTSDLSSGPCYYNGPIRQENIQMASDGRYFLLIDDNETSSDEFSRSKTSSSSTTSSDSAVISTSIVELDRKTLIHRLVFPKRLGRIIFYRRTLSESDIYQKLCSKDQEIDNNVYHLDTVRDYSMEFYMLTTYGSDSQLRAWCDMPNDECFQGTYYFNENRFPSSDEDEDEHRESSVDSILCEDDLQRLQDDEELDWYSELDSFNLMPNQNQVS